MEDGFVLMGVSKRGWSSWLAATADSSLYPKVIGVVPLVPITPSLQEDLHRMYQSYGGFTFAFHEYMKTGLTAHLDEDLVTFTTKALDPLLF